MTTLPSRVACAAFCYEPHTVNFPKNATVVLIKEVKLKDVASGDRVCV